MLLTVFTDPHLDKTPVANTTAKSRKRWKKFLFDNPHEVVKEAESTAVCVGDLYDRTQVEARDVHYGCVIASLCRKVLGGNHDVENSLDSFSALSLVNELVPHVVVMPKFNEVVFHTDIGIQSFFIPHHTSKELFAKALDAAENLARSGGVQYLFLHCNYNCEMATKETELNLSRDDAQRLIAAGFKRIFIGHDHNRKEDFDGKVIVIGSISPTSFGDCESDHGYYTLDTENNSVEFHRQWIADMRFIRLTVEDVITTEPDELLEKYPHAHLFRVAGEIEPTQAVEFTRALRKLWVAADKQDRLFGIKVDARIKTLNLTGQAVQGASGVLNLKAQIMAELSESPEMLALWKELLEELKND